MGDLPGRIAIVLQVGTGWDRAFSGARFVPPRRLFGPASGRASPSRRMPVYCGLPQSVGSEQLATEGAVGAVTP